MEKKFRYKAKLGEGKGIQIKKQEKRLLLNNCIADERCRFPCGVHTMTQKCTKPRKYIITAYMTVLILKIKHNKGANRKAKGLKDST